MAYELVRWAPLLWGGLIIQHIHTHSENQKFTETKGERKKEKKVYETTLERKLKKEEIIY